jgi:hypothetical protein
MNRQTRISDTGEIELGPLTWDGEPLWSPSTVAEGLFDADAFEQLPGQLAIEQPFKVGDDVLLPDADVASKVTRILNDGRLLEVRNPYALAGDTQATVRVRAEQVRHAE